MHTTELTKQNTASRIHDPRTCLNLCFHKIYRHHVRYFSMWIMSHRQNQLKWKIRRDTDRSRLLCRPPFSLENQHTTEPRCSVVCVYAARLCASRLGGVEGHPWYSKYVFLFYCQAHSKNKSGTVRMPWFANALHHVHILEPPHFVLPNCTQRAIHRLVEWNDYCDKL